MNILFITCWFPIPRNPNFGIFVKEHARAVQRAGANIQLVHIWAEKSNSLYKTKFKREEDSSGLTINSLIIYSRFYKFFRYFWFLLYYPFWSMVKKRVLPEFEPDCLHGNVIYPAGFLTYSLAEKLNKPYILTEHWTKVESFFNSFFFSDKAKDIFDKATAIHPVSEFLSRKIEKSISNTDQISVIPNVVGDQFGFNPSPRNDNLIELLCIMNHKQKPPVVKRPDLLIRALDRIPRQKQEKFCIRFIGPNQENSPVKTIIENRNIQAQFFFDGIKPKSYVAEQMNKVDYLAHPTEFETFGVVVAEALTCGLPCIVSDILPLRELVDSTNSILVPNNTAEEWANVLEKIFENYYSFNKEKIASEIGDRFSYERIGASYIASYKKALNQ